MSPRIGRPPADNPKTDKLTVRLDANCTDILDRYCKQQEVKRSEAMRQGVLLLEKSLN
ncbi:hypothetical protein [Anaeromicropila populeti]|uniref:Ribbon-helix-helix protein, copG family n=1 Tax=Anaeromicropila populeti TaxID=37658 RepID=A0A1I6KU00_9FIRM|nr:hypothetical protein [Anaeromicropila populeti]SFR94706.1 hypothetical protein SAMN05661086_02726 [Anaeromicropila populeti]